MRMWKVMILHMFLCSIIAGCTNPQFKLDKNATSKLAEMPGQIELKYVGSGKYWHYSIIGGELLLQDIKDVPPAHLEMRPYIYFPKEAPNGLPMIECFEYHGPYCLSPDNTLMVSSISSETRGASNAKDFVIIQDETKEILFQRRSNNKYFVEDIAWAPDSSMFAVLDKSLRRSLSIPDIIWYILGHPVDVGTFYISIYDRNGNLLLNTEVASRLLGGGSGRVSWQAKADK